MTLSQSDYYPWTYYIFFANNDVIIRRTVQFVWTGISELVSPKFVTFFRTTRPYEPAMGATPLLALAAERTMVYQVWEGWKREPNFKGQPNSQRSSTTQLASIIPGFRSLSHIPWQPWMRERRLATWWQLQSPRLSTSSHGVRGHPGSSPNTSFIW